MEKQEEKKDRKGAILWLLLLLLLGSLGLNIYLFSATEKKDQLLNKEMVDSDHLRTDFQKQMDSAKAQLQQYKGKTAEMDALIKQKEQDLEEKAKRISVLLRDNRVTYNKFVDAKDEIDKWKYYAGKYLKQVDELSEENKRLSAENKGLNEVVQKNKKDMDKLIDENITYKNKVSLGEQLKATNINITGIKMRSSGKERETNRAGQIEKIKICFDIPENHVANNGNRDIYIKVNDPSGQPVVIQSLGSGTFSYQGAESSYTTKEQIFYDNDPKNYCVYWGFAKDAHLKSGTYTIELYTEGYQMGAKNFTVK